MDQMAAAAEVLSFGTRPLSYTAAELCFAVLISRP